MDTEIDLDPSEQRMRELGERLNTERDEFASFFEDWIETMRDKGLWSGDLDARSQDAERIASAAMREAIKLLDVPPATNLYVSLGNEQ